MKENWDKSVADAIDLIAEGKEEQGQKALEDIITRLKVGISDIKMLDTEKGQRYYYWGLCLQVLEEWEQALLRFESAVEADGTHEEAWWQIVTILLYTLDNPESARRILQEKILPVFPKRERYLLAQSDAMALERLRKREMPMDAKEDGDDDSNTETETLADK